MYILYTEDTSRGKALTKSRGKKLSSADAGDHSPRLPGMRPESTLQTGVIDNTTNPLFLNKNGSSSSDSIDLDAVMAQRSVPSQELWNAFQDAFAEQSRMIDQMGTQLSTSRRREELGADQDPVSPRTGTKRNFAPTTAAPAALPAGFSSKVLGKSLRQLGKQ
jgi:hypothetical protein